ncbi:MAG TPA: hypothetical protein VK233_02245 [Candidatus Dormibacteraeota bacterium]|nr:hypothetical protein [Candidatus Dormibacteraeota bacterium]
MSHARWWRPLAPPLLAIAVLMTGSAATALAAYPASIDVNTTAFNPPCDDDANAVGPKMQTAAKAEYGRLGYVASAFTGATFTRAATLNRTPKDWGYYVHSHGDYYWNSTDARRYTGFREDSGDCSQAVIFSKDIKAKRLGRQSNLVFISTCHASDSVTTLPDAFAIAKTKSISPANQGPEFYVGYIGVRWDSDEWIFEQRFWNALANNQSAGAAFDIAMNGSFNDGAFDANWWGTYTYGGVAGPWTVCPTCS